MRAWKASWATLCAALCASRAAAAIGVTLAANPSGPAPVGTLVTWTAQAVGTDSSSLWFRFRVFNADGSTRLIRDYGPLNSLDWTSLDEGVYGLEASVRDRETGDEATTRSAVTLVTRVTGNQPVVSPTSHPLVALYSAPPCTAGTARVTFQSEDGAVFHTPYKPCISGRSLNFYLAGLAADMTYTAALTIVEGADTSSALPVTFQTGDADPGLPALAVLQAAAGPDPQPVLLQTPLGKRAIASDMSGRLLWFGPSDLSYLTRPVGDGTFLGLSSGGISPEQDVVRRFDLVGMTVQETNVARVSEQLVALGKRSISGFHHEARILSNGSLLLLADVEQILTGVQGPGPVDVIGDMIIVLDRDLQVAWTWDTFDHLDPSRSAVLGEACPTSPGCPPHYLSVDANDWTHGNVVSETPDGALLYSARHQDWLIKVDYGSGMGAGDVIWRLGKDGDFTYDSTDPYPWFSHQHDAGYAPSSRSVITLFDNGNTRVALTGGGSSRGQAIQVDEARRTVRAVVSAEIGAYSSALGSAQRLDDGTYHFEAGLIVRSTGQLPPSGSVSLQFDSLGTQVESAIALPVPVYRSFRLKDLYGGESAESGPTQVIQQPRRPGSPPVWAGIGPSDRGPAVVEGLPEALRQ